VARMELKHMKGFQACAQKSQASCRHAPFRCSLFLPLHVGNSQTAAAKGKGGSPALA